MNLSELRGTRKGEDIFVFGSGPSLHFFDMNLIRGRAVICVNSSILKYKNPDYYLTSDGGQVYKHHWQYVQVGTFPVLLSSQGAMGCVQLHGPIPDMSRVCSFQKEHTAVMDANADDLIFGITSAHCAVHFAVILGASRIIIVGCDSQLGSNKELYFFDYDGEEKDFFTMPEHVVDHSTVEMYVDGMLSYWWDIMKANPRINIQCVGGALETIFPKYQGD